MEKIPLVVSGVMGQARAESNAYTLILTEAQGNRRLAVVIGMQEAQAIAIYHEGMRASRPLVYDIVAKMASGFSIDIQEVVITNFERGIFYAEIVCTLLNGGEEDIVRLEARTSDAVALALKFGSPIYTYEPVLQEAGFELGIPFASNVEGKPRLETLNVGELNELLQKAVVKEDYEFASKIRDEITKRKQQDF